MQTQNNTPNRTTAGLIFTGGQVHTVNATNDIAEAVAVGDRAIEQTLTAMARAQHGYPRQRLRHRIEPCAISPPDLQDRVRAQHIISAVLA